MPSTPESLTYEEYEALLARAPFEIQSGVDALGGWHSAIEGRHRAAPGQSRNLTLRVTGPCSQQISKATEVLWP